MNITLVRTYQKRKVPCKFCPNRIEVSRYAFEELNYIAGVCEECQQKMRNAPECETCHLRLFQGCDQCRLSGTRYHEINARLYHKTVSDSYKDEHVCEYHWNEYLQKIKVIAGYYDE